MAVLVGVDSHKESHTAVAIDRDESELARVTVRASRRQVDELLRWAARFEDRVWAIESAGGLGYLLSRQLVAVREQVLDVPATLAARVRLLGSGRSNKNDPNDARSVAIAALRVPRLARVGRDRPCRCVAVVREAQPRPRPGPEPHRVPTACVVGRARPRRDLQGNQRSQRPAPPRIGHADDACRTGTSRCRARAS